MTAKVAFITGAGSGIGAATAIQLAKHGWNIAITTLAHERGGSAPHARIYGELTAMLKMAKTVSRDGVPVTQHPLYRQRLAQSLFH